MPIIDGYEGCHVSRALPVIFVTTIPQLFPGVGIMGTRLTITLTAIAQGLVSLPQDTSALQDLSILTLII